MNTLRLTRIELSHFKNVSHGEIEMMGSRRVLGGSLLTLFGPNGSGKTALIDAISVLKCLMTGEALPSSYIHLIEVNQKSSTLAFDFLLGSEVGSTQVYYEVTITRNRGEDDVDRVRLLTEKLSWRFESEELMIRKTRLIETDDSDVAFMPTTHLQLLTKDDNKERVIKNEIAFLLERQRLYECGRSYVWSDVFLRTIKGIENQASHWSMIASSIARLKQFACQELFVLRAHEKQPGVWDALLSVLNAKDSKKRQLRHTSCDWATRLLSAERLSSVQMLISNLNRVLEKVIPGLKVVLQVLGPGAFDNSESGVYVRLMSLREGQEAISLEHESDGVKRIVEMLAPLIMAYNKSTVIVAIDRIDEDIFEYLLGELLQLFSEKAKGQLILTSNNLRPLEMIDRRFVVFATTDKNARYTKMTNLKRTNNLRDVYYRELSLGDGRFYQHTNTIDMAHTFKVSGACLTKG